MRRRIKTKSVHLKQQRQRLAFPPSTTVIALLSEAKTIERWQRQMCPTMSKTRPYTHASNSFSSGIVQAFSEISSFGCDPWPWLQTRTSHSTTAFRVWLLIAKQIYGSNLACHRHIPNPIRQKQQPLDSCVNDSCMHSISWISTLHKYCFRGVLALSLWMIALKRRARPTPSKPWQFAQAQLIHKVLAEAHTTSRNAHSLAEYCLAYCHIRCHRGKNPIAFRPDG